MTLARLHEHEFMYNTRKPQLASPARGPPLTSAGAQAGLAFILWFALLPSVNSSPLQLGRRESSDGSQQQMSPKIWVPVVIAAIFLFCVVLVSWSKSSFRRSINFFGAASAVTPGAIGPGNGARELTAEQLAGTINGELPANSASAPPRTRRQRRPRRTPSQMSTTSLPAYNKEPGEEEVVIFRGHDPEDVTLMPAATVMNSMDEDGEGSMHIRQGSQGSYAALPSSGNDSFSQNLDGDTTVDLHSQLSQPPGEGMPRHNSDNSSHETSSLLQMGSNVNLHDTRGEAPPYLEIDSSSPPLDSVEPSAHNVASSSPLPEPTPAPAATSNRQSGFRQLLNRMSVVVHPQSSPVHNRTTSAVSAISSLSPRTAGHRQTPSSSTLLSSPSTTSLFRPLSRQRSTHTLASQRLNSPSMISLNSISSPLTHTAVRTEFTYPKSGPTPQQLKIIASRDSVARFAVPFGEDAIRYAQSPPAFDGTAGPSLLNGSSLDLTRSTTSLSASAPSTNSGSAAQSEIIAPTTSISPPSDASQSSNALPDGVPATTSSAQAEEASNRQFLSISKSTATRLITSPPASPYSVSEFGTISGPPSSFHNSVNASARSDSRVSAYSVRSYATAAESLAGASTIGTMRSAMEFTDDFDSDMDPGTPGRTHHALESTDSTVLPRSI